VGGPADPPNTFTDFDSFKTYNQFYGGQIGGRLNWTCDHFDLELIGKVALGATQELVVINGVSTVTAPGSAPVTNPGGLLAEPTNSGRFFHSSFAAVPEFGLNVGYKLTEQLRVNVGYSFLYWSAVARPGDQIDRTVSASQVARDPTFGSSPADRPVFQLHENSFWAHGLKCGLEWQF
jgi:hypothetical protein